MADWFTHIESTLAAAGWTLKSWRAGDGRLLLTPFGARLLACQIEGVDGNLFWHSPDLEDQAKVRELLRTGGLAGGDRLWLAPEVGFFWPDLREARKDTWKTYRVPPRMDPGDWRIVEEAPDYLRLVSEFGLEDGRVHKNIGVRLERELHAIAPPAGLPRDLRCVSFAIRNDLTVLEAQEGTMAGTWDLLQVPAGGDLVCPTAQPVDRPRIYYGAFDPERMRSDGQALRFRLDGKRQLKLGLTPEQTNGRMGYFRVAGDTATLVVRLFQPRPGEPYVDVPLSSHEMFGGDALQSYNDDGRFGGFGEMEYHDAALIVGRRPTQRSGSCVTHVLAGPEPSVRQAGRMLLGVEV